MMNITGIPKLHLHNKKNRSEVTLRTVLEKNVVNKIQPHGNVNDQNVCDIYELDEFTPLRLHSVDYKNIDSVQEPLFADLSHDDKKRRHSIISRVSERFSWQSAIKVSTRIQSPLSIDAVPNYLETNIGIIEEDDISIAPPSGLYLPVTNLKMAFPEEITICLEETETAFLFEMPSVTVTKGTDEGDITEKENEKYEYITVGKGRNRKTVSTEAQTNECILKTRHTLAPRIVNKNDYAFASAWDMYDSFKPINEIKAASKNYNNMTNISINKCSINENEPMVKEDFDLMHNLSFLDAIIVMERVLANNVFRKQQELYKDIIEAATSKSKCQLELLWTFSSDETTSRTVTAVCCNTFNSDIIAVGYGKFRYSDKKDGLVCVWSIKNPTQPERIYHFATPVTSMAFSQGNPNFLAVGFYNGTVIIMDVTVNEKKILTQSSRKTSPSYEPIWQTLWRYGEDLNVASEQVITVGQDGRISRFMQTKTKDLVCAPMMRITRIEENISDINDEYYCKTNEIPILIYPPCLLFCHHPVLKDIYFIGTADGCIYKCSTNYLNQHISVIYAHDGPVYGMEFSHFCPKVFITCGADWTVKVWIEDISEPLIVLTTTMDPVESAVFCPTHSTVIAAISGTNVFLWDLKQKIDMLVLEINLPSDLKKLTSIQFTRTGKNLIIADVSGGVHIYTLVSLPANSYHQPYLLEESLRKALTIKPDLLTKMKKVGKLY